MAGLATCFGSGAMSNSMDDVSGKAAAFFIIGSNTTEQHPVFGTMLRRGTLSAWTLLIGGPLYLLYLGLALFTPLGAVASGH